MNDIQEKIEAYTAQCNGSDKLWVWKLDVSKVDRSGILTCEDGNGNQIFSEAIKFTDFPIPEMVFWFEIDTLMLPCER